MKVVTIIGARPQFIKAAPLKAALDRHAIEEVLVDTGQHYDPLLSSVFLKELGLGTPDYSLNVGSGSHGHMTGKMLMRIEDTLIAEQPDCTIVFGDTNSTLAGALASAKLGIPVAHIEAGLRSHRMTMPEEINRRATDHISSLLFCPTSVAVNHLRNEGIATPDCGERIVPANFDPAPLLGKDRTVINVGDIMLDALQDYAKTIKAREEREDEYILLTLHRSETTDSHNVMRHITDAVAQIADFLKIIFPIHPRTGKVLDQMNLMAPLKAHPNIECVKPMPYGEFIRTQAGAQVIVTDSGGVQKEACMLGVPCLTIRDETEWTETVESGWNALLGRYPENLLKAVQEVERPKTIPSLFGDGKASDRIAKTIQAFLSKT